MALACLDVLRIVGWVFLLLFECAQNNCLNVVLLWLFGVLCGCLNVLRHAV